MRSVARVRAREAISDIVGTIVKVFRVRVVIDLWWSS